MQGADEFNNLQQGIKHVSSKTYCQIRHIYPRYRYLEGFKDKPQRGDNRK